MSQSLVIVVTGANSGVGFSICHRLLIQLSSPSPPDAQPYFHVESKDCSNDTDVVRDIVDAYEFSPDSSVTIVMACRHSGRAQTARDQLYKILDKHIAKLKRDSDELSYATRFRNKVRLELETLDLSSVKSVLAFGRALSIKYEYISHLICNAGTATYSHLDILGFTWDIIRCRLHGLHFPRRNMQVNGVLSKDGLGYTWQCNTFGHYVLYRTIQPLLLAYTRASGRSSRVLWMSSLDAEPAFDLKDDWQLIKTYHSYQASKYQCELICTELEKRAIEAQETGSPSSMPDLVPSHGEIHHLLVSPGISVTNMYALLKIWIPAWRYIVFVVFFLVRLFGSPHILLSQYASAASAVHVALVPLRAVPTARNYPRISPDDVEYPHWHSYHKHMSPRVLALRFGSENDRWGNDRPGVVAVPVWEEHPDAGEVLLERFERLYQVLLTAEGEHL